MMNTIVYMSLLFSGKNHQYFRQARTKRGLTDIVQIHHIIPREFRNHPTIIESRYNIEDGYNLMFLPTRIGRELLILHIDRPIHYGGHLRYNKYVCERLDEINKSETISYNNLCGLNHELRENMRHCKIDWN